MEQFRGLCRLDMLAFNRGHSGRWLFPELEPSMSQYFADKTTCSHHTIFPGVDIHTLAGQHMMLSLVEFQPGAIVEKHSHPHEQMGMLVSGRAHFFVGDEDRVVGPGAMYRIPGGVPHRVVALDGPAVALDFFHPIREDYR